MASPHPPGSSRPPSTEQLRADIDSGQTGDKVAYPDPAAAPLGADDEAGGQISPAVDGRNLRASRAQQARARKGTPSGNPDARSRSWIYIAAAVAFLVFLLLLGTMMPYQQR